MPTERYKLIASANLILTRGDDVLLSRRFNTGFSDGDYSIIGGHLESGETVRQAVVREAREEIGIVIQPADLRLAVLLHDWYYNGKERLQCFFTTDEWSGAIVNREPQWCDDLKWFPFTALPSNMVLDVRKVLASFRRGENYVEYP